MAEIEIHGNDPNDDFIEDEEGDGMFKHCIS